MQSELKSEKKAYELSRDQISSYRQDGYLVVPNVFSHDECDYILDKIRLYANRDFAAIMNPDRPEFLLAQLPECKYAISDTEDAPAIGIYVDRVQEVLARYDDNHSKAREFEIKESILEDLLNTSLFLREVMRDTRQKNILETLQEREVVALMSQMLFKEAGTRYAREQAWKPHQDNAYPQNPNGQYITTNLFLADANKENGTLYIYPGSHKLGLLSAESAPSYREAKGKAPGSRTLMPTEWEDRHVDVNFNKGDLLVLHGNCIHGSYSNFSKRSRPLYSCSLISKGEYFIPGANARRMEIPLS